MINLFQKWFKYDIPFNKPFMTKSETYYIKEAQLRNEISGNGFFTKKCQFLLQNKFNLGRTYLTSSCTSALEMACLLIGLKPGDEVIMPSFTFVSTANAVVLRGATPVFVDIDEKTLCLDVSKIEKALSKKTKAIIIVHYAGISVDMNYLTKIAKKNKIYIIEDSAQSLGSKYGNKYLGSFGDFACFSFHETKNISSGHGGALVVNNSSFIPKASMVWEKGTNREQYFMGIVDKYTWTEIGSSFLPGEITAAFLYAQLQNYDFIQNRRRNLWNRYVNNFKDNLHVDYGPNSSNLHNSHMFYLLFDRQKQRDAFIYEMRKVGVQCVFHYQPLHLSPMGLKHGKVFESLDITENVATRIVRLPLYSGMTNREQDHIIKFANCVLKREVE